MRVNVIDTVLEWPGLTVKAGGLTLTFTPANPSTVGE